jgi:hypothetical protein
MSDFKIEPNSAQRPRKPRSNQERKHESAHPALPVDHLPVATPSEVAPPPLSSPASVTRPVQLTLEQIVTLKSHPWSEIFPLLSDRELETLADDIKANGLREPIVLMEEDGEWKLLDGRNRYSAIIRHLSLSDLSFVAFSPGPDDQRPLSEAALAYVMSRNFLRRHLSDDQRAVIAARYYGQRSERVWGGDRKSSSAITELDRKPSAEEQKQALAHQAKISVTQIERASALVRKNPAKAEEVAVGRKTLVQAEAEVKKADSPVPAGPVRAPGDNFALTVACRAAFDRIRKELPEFTAREIGESFCGVARAEACIEAKK